MRSSPPQTTMELAQHAAELERIRNRTLELVEPLSEQALNAVHDRLMSPIIWDLGHIANFEEFWIAQCAWGRKPLREELGSVYDPFTAPRSERGKLPYLRTDQCLEYLTAVRERTLELMEASDEPTEEQRLLADGYVYDLVARHEQQHSETILQTLQLMTSEPYVPVDRRELPGNGERREEMVLVEEGEFELGAAQGPFSYDNERPRHLCAVDAFWIDAQPVTNAQFCAWIEDGGYESSEWWSKDGWQWRERNDVTLPSYWRRYGRDFVTRRFSELEPLNPLAPVCHVSWYEADAFARYAGKRLPTEPEWEKAASWDAASTRKRRYPWGDERPTEAQANLDQLGFGVAPVGAYADHGGAGRIEQLMGDVWEWTASGFDAYPGFEAYPYSEYSEPFFGGPFKVLRGGSWATQPDAVTATFRNWDYPQRRQIFAGFRCARDADPSTNGAGTS